MSMGFRVFGSGRRSARANAQLLASANAARDRREWSVAASLYEQYLSIGSNAGRVGIWVQLGNMRKEAGFPQMALAAYQVALKLEPMEADTHLQLGHLAKVMGNIGDAEHSYAEALRLQPDLEHAQVELERIVEMKAARADEHVKKGSAGPAQNSGTSNQEVSGDREDIGVVDEIRGLTIQGWAAPFGAGGRSNELTITVTHAGQQIAKLKADRYRPDVAKQAKCDPYCGFVFKVPALYRTRRNVTFSFYAEPGHIELSRSPFTFNLDASGKAKLARLNHAVEEMSTNLWRMRRDLQTLISDEVTELDEYDSWARRYQDALRFRVKNGSKLPRTPLVSVICPVYRPRLADFQRAVQSVLNQTYRNWELILIDDNGSSDEVTRTIEGFCKDERVRALPQPVNAGISAATNVGIAAAKGEYIALFDHDDMLLDVALEVMIGAALKTGARMIYSDEDKVDDYGRFLEPNLKPDWNYRLMIAQNYACHFLVVRADVLRAAGPLNKVYDGAQDHDLILRLSEIVPATQIHHVPEIIYHWRKTPGSTASEIGNKSYAVDAGAAAVRDHLKRRGLTAELWPMLGVTCYSIDWRFTDEPKVCVVIPFKEQIEITRRCVQSLLNDTHYKNFQIILVDNWSDSEDAIAFRNEAARWRNTEVIVVEEPFNYARLNNLACARTDAEYLVFMNNDVFVKQADWLRRMVDEAMANKDVAAVGPKLLYPDGSVQHGGVILGVGGIADHAGRGRSGGDPHFQGRGICAQELSAVTAALMLCRHSAFDAVKGFDEQDLAVAYNDVDLCLKLRRAGHKIIYLPGVVAEHQESVSRGSDMTDANVSRFLMEERTMHERWKAELANDPHYNPNFSRDGGLFEELSATPLTYYLPD